MQAFGELLEIGTVHGVSPFSSDALAKSIWRDFIAIADEYNEPGIFRLGRELGVNPYKLGMNASTDTHTGLATSREENHFGKMPHTEPSANRFDRDFKAADIATPDFVAKGYRNGVPMGGELRNAPANTAPGFMMQALRDPDASGPGVHVADLVHGE